MLTSPYAPAVGASLSGFLLGVYPADQFRTTIAMMSLSSAAEVTYNTAENAGLVWGKKGSNWERPWWFGSWMVMPFAFGQLLHAFVFDRDCFPKVSFKAGLSIVLILNFAGIWRFYTQAFTAIYTTAARRLSGKSAVARDIRHC
jgi:hypothetical protein